MNPTGWQSEEAAALAIRWLIETGAMRICPRCRYVPVDRDETIFEPLGVHSQTRVDTESNPVAVTVLTLACTHCGFMIEHCLDYLNQPESSRWEDALYLGLGSDPEYDVLAEVARICGADL